MKTLVEKFKCYLTEQGMSDNTIKSYMISVYTYYNIYGPKINNENLSKFQTYLQESYQPKSMNLRVISFNKFLKFAGYSSSRLRMVKCQQRNFLDGIISYSDYLKFKGLLKQEIDKKWYYIVWTLAATGVRISELVRFRAEHIFDGQLDAVNALRTRAGIAPLSDITMDVVKKEKSYELWLEGCRYIDILRWGDTQRIAQAGSDVPKLFDKLFVPNPKGTVTWENDRFYTISSHEAKDRGFDCGYKPKHRWFPFPYDVMNKNPNLVQNDGWEE